MQLTGSGYHQNPSRRLRCKRINLQTQRQAFRVDFEHLLGNQSSRVELKAKSYTDFNPLKQLTQDISIDLFKLSGWDTFILQDALKLLRYTLDNLFDDGDNKSDEAKDPRVTYE